MGFWSWLFGGSSVGDSGVASRPIETSGRGSQMNEGDIHSGPAGYSPNTSYPETQYGSGFDEDAAWHEGES